MSEVVFFFGAGASAPFGIPTMKQFVTDFEKSFDYGDRSGAKEEKKVYMGIKQALEKRLGRPVDLEAIFSVIDGILNYSPEGLGLLSLYFSTGFDRPTDREITICKSLREKFQNFVREKCITPTRSFEKIKRVYHDFFNRFVLELGGSIGQHDGYAYETNWTMFTTNYDLCLEYYWREVAGVKIDTGFRYDTVRKADVLNPVRFLSTNIGMQLFKLHGSVSWLIEEKTGDIFEVTERGKSYIGRRYEGEMMLYPIAEKALYLDPYISMLLRLNRELERKSVWAVIGYSFNDSVIREIFLRNFNKKKHLILVHPQAKGVLAERLDELKGRISPMNDKFGIEWKFSVVNYDIIRRLKDNPTYNWDKTPTQ